MHVRNRRRVRKWADAQDEANQKYRDAHVWYDSDKKSNYTGYKLLIADVVHGRLAVVPRGVKSHLAKYYTKMGDTAPWER
jgi:hypothetical protein